MIGQAGWAQAKAVARVTIGKATIAVAVTFGEEMAEVGETAVVVGMRMAAVVGVEEVGGTALVGGKLRGQLCRNADWKVVGRKMVATATTVVVERRKQARAMHARARATHLQQATEMHPKARVVHPKAREGHQRARPPRAIHHLLAHLGPTAPPLQYLEHLRAFKIVC